MKAFTFGLVLLIPLAVVAIAPPKGAKLPPKTKQASERTRRSLPYLLGYRDGYDEGFTRGSAQGFERGLREGYERGYEEAKATYWELGWETGWEEGWNKCQDDHKPKPPVCKR